MIRTAAESVTGPNSPPRSRVGSPILNLLLETTSDVVVVLSPQGKILEWNRAAEEVHAFRRSEVVGLDYFDLFIASVEKERAQSAWTEILDAGVTRELELPRPAGSAAGGTLRWHVSRLEDAEGRLLGGLAVGHDQSELQDTRRELRHAEKMAELGQLMSGVVHDFNNVLLTVAGRTERLQQAISAESPQRRDVDAIAAAASRAARLSRRLLSLSRNHDAKRQRVDLNDAIRDAADLLADLLDENVELKVRLGDIPVWVRADRVQIEQLVLNLAVNARDAMPEGGRLTLEARVVGDVAVGCGSDGQTPWALLAVEDNGAGMDDETRRRAFDPFFTTKHAGQGTGLGLAIVRDVVTGLSGQVQIESRLGHGTRIEVHLPLCGAPRQPTPEQERPSDTTAPAAASILLVEDDDDALDLLHECLEQNGWRVCAARNGEEALEVFTASPDDFDVVVTDWVMPRMSGERLVDRIRALRPGVGAIFISGYTARDFPEERLHDEGVRFLHKPFSMRDLRAAVGSVLLGQP